VRRRTVVIILTVAVVIMISLGGYKAYANHLDHQHYQEAQTAINKLFKDKKQTILSPQVNETAMKAVQSKINKVKDQNNKLKLNNELRNAKTMLKMEDIANKNITLLIKMGSCKMT
jgi:predicted AAA+ superfamily ATPase